MEKNKFVNKSPLRYPGGKTRACDILNKILLDNFDVNKFNQIISPFFGGGSFEFDIQNRYNYKIIANDKFQPLYNFWKTCQFNKEELSNLLYKDIGHITKDNFLKFREEIMSEQNCIKQAMMYFIINRCSFSGATLSGGFSLESSKKRFTKSSIDRLASLNLDKQYFEIYNLDFIDFFNQIDNSNNSNNSKKSIIFLDPPYYLENKSKLYGLNGDIHIDFNHIRLFEILKNKKNWMMTYNNCDFIKQLYNGYKIIETNWNYGMNKSKKSSEIVIIG